MKRLLLMRHAKSSWDDSDLADFDRPLNDRGEAAAPFMGELIAGRGLAPEEIVSSPAKRALQTATLVKESGGIEAPIRLDERIYEAGAQTLKQVASEFRDELDIMMMIGHNPGFEGFVSFLTGKQESMPTAALAVIDLDIDKWSDVKNGEGDLIEVIRPKEQARNN
jgi:Phosphohistidine phosphatase SixA